MPSYAKQKRHKTQTKNETKQNENETFSFASEKTILSYVTIFDTFKLNKFELSFKTKICDR